MDGFSDSVSSSEYSQFQEYFSVPDPDKLTCAQVLASYEADIPPVYRAKEEPDLYSRGGVKQSEVSKIRSLTNQPEGVTPPVSLNTWKDLTPNIKLPDIRHRTQGRVYYTRGLLGKKLHKAKPEFDVSDPSNKRKVLNTFSYSALHDPHCASYLSKPGVLKLLRKQKLINERGEVLCDAHEFNHYRSYLGELFNDQVKRRIDDNEAMKDLERNLSRAVFARRKQRQLDEHKLFQLEHLKINAAYAKSRRNKYEENIKNWHEKLRDIEAFKAKQKVTRMGKYTLKHWNAYTTRQKGLAAEARRKKNTLTRIAYAEIKNDYVTKYDKFVRLALFERYKADQAAVLVARDDQIDDMYQLVDETLKRHRSTWLKKYAEYITECRKNPLANYQEQVKTEARAKYLMKKYFKLWVAFVKRKRQRGPDESHQSLFNATRVLKPIVEDMKHLPPPIPVQHHKGAKRRSKRISNDEESNMSQATIDEESHGDYNRKQNQKRVGGDGNEADVDEADGYIDRVVARYKRNQALLREKLIQSSPNVQSHQTGYPA